MVINDVCIPAVLSISGKKPWEVNHLDTMELWKFGDYKSYTSLNLLAHVLGIPTPKDDIDGSMVGHVYWHGRDVQRIVEYCQKDVITLAQIYLRLTREQLILPENIIVKQ
jgi:predicted PolB exonuclease-like 3'-5' exonuclease